MTSLDPSLDAATAVPPLAGDVRAFLDGRAAIALSRVDNADGVSLIDHHLPCGDGPPLHVHHGEDEIFVILAGEVRFEVGGVLSTARAGDTVVGPRGVPHRYRVVSPAGARYLTITTGGFEAMVRSVSRPVEAGFRPARQATPPSPEMQAALAAACVVNGIELIGPPLPA